MVCQVIKWTRRTGGGRGIGRLIIGIVLAMRPVGHAPMMTGHKEGTMLEYSGRTQPIEKPGRLELAIREWQRQLIDKVRIANDEGQSNGLGGAAVVH